VVSDVVFRQLAGANGTWSASALVAHPLPRWEPVTINSVDTAVQFTIPMYPIPYIFTGTLQGPTLVGEIPPLGPWTASRRPDSVFV
jgi:hypothetical protein